MIAADKGGRKLLDLADELGFVIMRRSRRGRHVLLQHEESNAIACLPLCVAEQGRDFLNYRAALRRIAGVTERSQERPCERTVTRRLERRNQNLKLYTRMMDT